MDTAPPDYFTDPKTIDDPAGYFANLRARCPVFREPHHGALMVTGYDEVMEVLAKRDGSLSNCCSVLGPLPPLPFTPEGDDIRDQIAQHRGEIPWSDHLSSFDGEKHSAHRALLTRLLTHERLKRNEDYLAELADRVIDQFIDAGRCNLMPEFSHAVTTYAVSDLMGIPESHRAELVKLLGATPSSIEGDPVHKVGSDPLVFLAERFTGYIAERVGNPGTDLLSELANSRFKDGTRPSVTELALLARFLFGAAQDTTTRLIGMAALMLAENPELQAQLRQDRSKIPDFLEETLRIEGPVKTVFRIAQLSTTIGGQPVPAGTVITAGLMAANRDPAHFENPDVFDMDRPKLRDHLAFSRGAHGCPGAPLARMKARIAINALLDRLSDIRISEAHHGPEGARHYKFEPTYGFRSLSALHIEFTRA
jgi:cytochrome P450